MLASSLFANGDTVAYGYNNLGLVSVIAQNGYNKYKWSYNSSGVPMQHQDLVNNEKYLYTYDSIGRLIRYEIQSNDTSATHIGTTEFAYDVRNNLSRIYLEFGGKSVAAQYKYSAVAANDNSAAFAKDNLPTQFYINSTRHLTYSYNGLNQLTRRNLSTTRPINYNYTYKESDRPAEEGTTYRTNLLERETIDNTTYNYTYDNIGNITSIKKGSRLVADNAASFDTTTPEEYRSYTYDSLNQLTREINATTNKSTDFTYDGIGNITKKTERAYTEGSLGPVIKEISYRYGKDGKTGWNNLLTGVDLNGNGTYSTSETISYDEIGNPLTYLGNELDWNGRQLKSFSGNGNTITYKYDADGYRATKTVNGGKTTYRYVNGQLVYEEKPDGKQLFYLYDSYGYLTSIRYYNSDSSTLIAYYVTTNAQGDVIGIYNTEGVLRASYEYDAWGNIISIKNGDGDTVTSDTHIAKLNSVRYRSYCYDNETGLYYVISRYYNPQVGRWLNADEILSTNDVLGMNVFAYCGNNPVTRTDSTGKAWYHWAAGGAVVVSAVAVVATVTTFGLGSIPFIISGIVLSTTTGGFVGGMANEQQGESFRNGWIGGAASGLIQSIGTFAMSKINLAALGTIFGGGFGSGVGTAITESLNNRGKTTAQQKSVPTIAQNSLKATIVGTIMSVVTAGIAYSVDYAMGANGYNSWANSLSAGEGIAPITQGFAEMLKAFYSAVDDAFTYIICN